MKNKRIAVFSLLLVAFVLPMVAFAEATLVHINVVKNNPTTRIELLLTKKTSYKVFTLARPNRLVVDLNHTELGIYIPNKTLKNPFVKKVRGGNPDPTRLRLVFDLGKKISYKTFYQSKKIIIDLQTDDIKTKSIPELNPKILSESIEPNSIATLVPTLDSSKSSLIAKLIPPVEKARPFVVVIDAGHGGKDSGAVGKYGSREKHIVLPIALRLAKLINSQPHMKAVLTRNGDYFVPLRGRLKLARKDKADVFIAIHADSYFNVKANGASVYALSKRGATSEAARWLAKQENYSELGGVNLTGLEDKSYMVRSVLIDLAQTATIIDSLRLGVSMLDALDDVTKLHHQRVEQAPFVVLKSPDIPSILVEIGFISNPAEERKLRAVAYQNKLAKALFDGMYRYFKNTR